MLEKNQILEERRFTLEDEVVLLRNNIEKVEKKLADAEDKVFKLSYKRQKKSTATGPDPLYDPGIVPLPDSNKPGTTEFVDCWKEPSLSGEAPESSGEVWEEPSK